MTHIFSLSDLQFVLYSRDIKGIVSLSSRFYISWKVWWGFGGLQNISGASQQSSITANCKTKKLKMAPHSLSPEALRSHAGLERCHFEGVNNVFSKLLFKWVSFLLQCSWFPPTSAATLFSCEAPEMFCGPLTHSNTFFLSKKAQQWHTELKKLWQEAVIIEKKKKRITQDNAENCGIKERGADVKMEGRDYSTMHTDETE